MAAYLRLPLRSILSPKSAPPLDHVCGIRSCSSVPTIACGHFPAPSFRRTCGAFYGATPRLLTHVVKSGVGDSSLEDAAVDDELQARGESTMPERFRHLNKEVPDPPVRWPWAVALFFLVYAWRTVLWELSNWKKAVLAILSAFGWLMKLALAFLFRFIGAPITLLIECVEYFLFAARHAYGSVVAFAPVPELARIILFASTILAIAEATVPNSVDDQHQLLAVAGLLGFGAIQGYVSDAPFLLSLLAMVCYSRFARKRDGVSAALPSAALLAAIGEPWLRAVVITSYLALAIAHHAKHSNEDVKAGVLSNKRKLPLPLVLASLAIGVHLAAKWIRYRHLTWMIV